MSRLSQYTEQQARFARAFSQSGACCSVYCEACGRAYFVTSDGHGDYHEGELEELRKKAAAKPDEYIEVPDFSSVSTAIVNGQDIVIGCLCDPTANWSKFIEEYSDEITEYLRLFWESRLEQGLAAVDEAGKALLTIDEAKHWQPMSDAPRDCTWISVRTKDGKTHKAHWASDLSGEEQPPFEEWFIETKGVRGFRQIEPIAWRHLEQ